jgi:hypothetical protein
MLRLQVRSDSTDVTIAGKIAVQNDAENSSETHLHGPNVSLLMLSPHLRTRACIAVHRTPTSSRRRSSRCSCRWTINQFAILVECELWFIKLGDIMAAKEVTMTGNVVIAFKLEGAKRAG